MPKTVVGRRAKTKAEILGREAGAQGTRALGWRGHNEIIESQALADQELFRRLARQARNQSSDSKN